MRPSGEPGPRAEWLIAETWPPPRIRAARRASVHRDCRPPRRVQSVRIRPPPSFLGLTDQGSTVASPTTLRVNRNGLDVEIALRNRAEESEEPCRNFSDSRHPGRSPSRGPDQWAGGRPPMLLRRVRGNHADDHGVSLSERDMFVGEVVRRFQEGLGENPIGILPEHEAEHAVGCRVEIPSKQEPFFELRLCRAQSDSTVSHPGIVSGETRTNAGPPERAMRRWARMGR